MVPAEVRTLFWDTDLSVPDPASYPDYAIFRALEFGDDEAVNCGPWMLDIRRVARAGLQTPDESFRLFGELVDGIQSIDEVPDARIVEGVNESGEVQFREIPAVHRLNIAPVRD